MIAGPYRQETAEVLSGAGGGIVVQAFGNPLGASVVAAFLDGLVVVTEGGSESARRGVAAQTPRRNSAKLLVGSSPDGPDANDPRRHDLLAGCPHHRPARQEAVLAAGKAP
jgi:hypothetical protein